MTLGSSCNRISIEIYDLVTYKDYMNRLNTLNYKVIKTDVEDEGVEAVYQTKSMTCVVTTLRFKPDANTNIPAYKFLFVDNLTYKVLSDMN
jgi:hypothetical protein